MLHTCMLVLGGVAGNDISVGEIDCTLLSVLDCWFG